MRRVVALLAAFALLWAPAAKAEPFAQVRPGVPLVFPQDHGAHPAFRTEWWYVTGWLETAAGKELGFQVTFFRSKTGVGDDNPSRFAPQQILFAHAAISDPAVDSLMHGERVARAGFGVAQAPVGDADVRIADWSLSRAADDSFETRVGTDEFAFALRFAQTQDVFEQGENGFSPKGPGEGDASHYYSLPQLAVTGTLTRGDASEAVTGTAWLDREWSSNFLMPGAVGWDWTGLNFDDGGALVAFRIRGADGSSLYGNGSYRRPDGSIVRLGPGDIVFETVREWRSARTGATYPVVQAVTLRLPEGERRLVLEPLFDDQELDGRASGMPVYWEGAVRTDGARGYLEMTGYAAALAL